MNLYAAVYPIEKIDAFLAAHGAVDDQLTMLRFALAMDGYLAPFPDCDELLRVNRVLTTKEACRRIEEYQHQLF